MLFCSGNVAIFSVECNWMPSVPILCSQGIMYQAGQSPVRPIRVATFHGKLRQEWF